jgi:hypothetical protein
MEAEEYERDQHRKAAWLWSQRWPISGTPAEVYLRGARGINCPLPLTLGYLPPFIGHQHAPLLRPSGDDKASTQRSKLIVGSPGAAPTVLAPVNDLLGIAITEGIEDALTAHQATGLGAWTAGNAGRMPALAERIPSSVECVSIFAHDDRAGQNGALKLASALVARGIDVRVEGLPR